MARMKERLYLRFRTPDGKQSPYCPVLYDKKSRLRAGWCLVRGVEERHPEATYYQRIKRDGKWAWQARGTDSATAFSKSAAIANQQEWETTKPKQKPSPELLTLTFRVEDEVKIYLDNVAKMAPKTYKAYKKTLELFRKSCNRIYMHEITKQDLQVFDSAMLADGYEDRTRHNRIQHLVTFLRNKEGRRLGPEIFNVTIKVKYVESQPEAYTRQELEDLFRVSSAEDKARWRFFLGTGFRESEASVAEAIDVNHDTKTIRVDEKLYFKFKPKDCEKRSVAISDALITEISARAKSGSCSLLFPSNGRPDGHLLRRLKIVAFKGGLNCGRCVGTVLGKEVSCADAPVCHHWILHRFRKNFATDRHNAGAAARKIQRWLGHSDLETTLRYLAVGEDNTDEIRNIVNGVHAGL